MSGNNELYFAPWERAFNRLASPFEGFLHRQTTTGILLIACAIIALFIANSPLMDGYDKLLHLKVGLTIGDWYIKHSIHHWINDGLMAIFFFVVGLEIKREVLMGELSSLKSASIPVLAAIGGMVVPALLYWAVNNGTEGIMGWGIPMATDIAFAVGVIALLGRRVPKSLVTFLVALAIVDDLGAVTVIAIFYTETIAMSYLWAAFFITFLLVMLNLSGVRNTIPYFILAVLLWIAMEGSGIHATIAGVIGAFTVPTYSRYAPASFSYQMRKKLDQFDAYEQPGTLLINNPAQSSIVWKIGQSYELAVSPLQRLENTWHIPSTYLVIPLFALANAAIPLDPASISKASSHTIAWGIMAGLVLGKPIGIAGSVILAEKLGLANLPVGVSHTHIIGASMLAGIGFTMSIFISELAFIWDGELVVIAKMGILAASLIAGIAGYLWLRYVAPSAQQQR